MLVARMILKVSEQCTRTKKIIVLNHTRSGRAKRYGELCRCCSLDGSIIEVGRCEDESKDEADTLETLITEEMNRLDGTILSAVTGIGNEIVTSYTTTNVRQCERRRRLQRCAQFQKLKCERKRLRREAIDNIFARARSSQCALCSRCLQGACSKFRHCYPTGPLGKVCGTLPT